MGTLVLQQLSEFDGLEGYNLLQRIGEKENDFTNPVHGMSTEQYKEWLKQQDAWSREEGLPDGYVGQTCFWLVAEGVFVGLGKIRHGLTVRSREEGGNIGIAIDPNQRGKGYGTDFIHLLIDKAKEMEIGEILITVKKFNYPSKKAFEKNGCFVYKETENWWYLTI
jgi:predicted acetyltransferase